MHERYACAEYVLLPPWLCPTLLSKSKKAKKERIDLTREPVGDRPTLLTKKRNHQEAVAAPLAGGKAKNEKKAKRSKKRCKMMSVHAGAGRSCGVVCAEAALVRSYCACALCVR